MLCAPLNVTQSDGGSACWRIHVCMAMPLATPALIDRVEPYWAIEQTRAAQARAGAESPGPSWPNRSRQRRGRWTVSIGAEPGRLSTPTTTRSSAAAQPASAGRCRGSGGAGTGRSPWHHAGSTAAGRRCGPRGRGRRWRCAPRCRCSDRAASSRWRRGNHAGERPGRPRRPRGASTGTGRRRCGGRRSASSSGSYWAPAGHGPAHGPTPTSRSGSSSLTWAA